MIINITENFFTGMGHKARLFSVYDEAARAEAAFISLRKRA